MAEINAVSLTRCCSLWDWLAENCAVSLTFFLSWGIEGMRLSGRNHCNVTYKLFCVFHGMRCDKSACQKIMSLHARKSLLHYSLAIGHAMRYCLAEIHYRATYILLVGMRCGETSWFPSSATHNLFFNMMRLLENQCSVTHSLLVMATWNEIVWQKINTISPTNLVMGRHDETSWQKSLQCHSQAVGRMRCDETSWQVHIYHSLAIGHKMRCNETAWQKTTPVSLTTCWSMWWNCLAANHCSITYSLLVVRCDEMRLPSRKSLQCYSLTVCHEMKWDCLQKITAVSFTACW